MNNIKIISMDFDGTLLTSSKKITDRTKKCLLKLKDKSYILIGITARNYLSVKEALDIHLFDYIILNNGNDIYYVKEDKIKNISYLENKTVENLYQIFNKISYQIDFCTTYRYLIKSCFKKDNRPVVRYIDNLDEIKDRVLRMNIYFKDDKTLNKSKSLIENKFNDVSVIKMLDTDIINSKTWLSINPKNTNKLNTLKIICKDLNYSLNEVIFFGDGENDLVLIENVGISVAMQNAINQVKEKASFITQSNDNDGIAKYLEENIK